MKRITRIICPIICMAVLLFAMTTAVMGCYQKETGPIDSRQNAFRHICASAISDSRRRGYPLGGQAELAEARAKNPDTVAWLYILGAEADDPVMQAEDNGYRP